MGLETDKTIVGVFKGESPAALYLGDELVWSPTAVTYSGVGTTGGSQFQSGSYNVPVVAGDRVVTFIVTDRASGDGYVEPTCGGVKMVPYANVRIQGAFGVGMLSCYISGPQASSGNAAIAYTASGAQTNSASMSYAEVQHAHPAVIAAGNGTALSQAVTVPARQGFAQAFGVGADASFSAVSGGTNRYNSSGNASLIANDVPVDATLVATQNSARDWAGVALPLAPTIPNGPRYVNLARLARTTIDSGLNFQVSCEDGDYVLLDVNIDRNTTVSAVTIDGVSPSTLAGPINYNGVGSQATLIRFGRFVSGSGLKTLQFSKTGGGWVVARATVIRGVSAVGATTTASNNGSVPSHAVTVSAGELAVHAFGATSVGTPRGGSPVDSIADTSCLSLSLAASNTTFTDTGSKAWGSVITKFN